LNKESYISIKYLFLLIECGVILFLLQTKTSFSQVDKNESSRLLIVGELLGKVAPEDISRLIQSNYYPVLRTNSEIKLDRVDSSPQQVVYQVIYPNENYLNRPKQIVFKFFESEYRLIAAIITEEIDFAITESYEAAEEIDNSTSSYTIHFRYPPPNFIKLIAYNNQHHILKNEKIRRALTYAINRNNIFSRLLRQQAYLADGPLSNESKFHTSGLDEYKFSPRKAIQLLQNENWKDTNGDGILDRNGKPFQFSITYEKGVLLDEQLVTRIKIDWNKLGIDVIRNPLFKSEIKKRLAQKNYDTILMNHLFEENIESFEAFFKSTSKENILGYKNRTVDSYIDLYKIQAPSTQKVLLQAIQKQINEDHPAAFLFFLWVDRYFVNRNKFTNFMDQKGLLLPFTEWNLKK